MEVLNDYTSSQLRKALFFAIKVWIYLNKELFELTTLGAKAYETDPPGLDVIEIAILGPEGQIVGIEKCPLTDKVLIFNDDLDNPLSGTYLMKFGRSETIHSILYWITKMITVWSDSEKEIEQ